MKVPGFYSLVLEDPESVAGVWLPFLQPGGLFVATRREHVLGEEVVLLVQLPGGAKQSVAGRVAWINADNLSRMRRRGAGIVLTDAQGSALVEEIRRIVEQEIAPADALLASC